MGCTNSTDIHEGLKGHSSEISALCVGNARDIDSAAVLALNNSIGKSVHDDLKQRLHLSFSLKDVPKLDPNSKSDCFLVFYEIVKVDGKAKKQKLGDSEIVWDNSNPDFVRHFSVDYFFEENQKFIVEAYDCDDENQKMNLKLHDFVGAIEFTLH